MTANTNYQGGWKSSTLRSNRVPTGKAGLPPPRPLYGPGPAPAVLNLTTVPLEDGEQATLVTTKAGRSFRVCPNCQAWLRTPTTVCYCYDGVVL